MYKVVLSYTALTKPLKTARMALKEVGQRIDSFFFMQDGSENDIKPYFYGSVSLGLIGIILIYSLIFTVFYGS